MTISTRITEQHPGGVLRALALAAGLAAMTLAGMASAQVTSIQGSKHDFTALNGRAAGNDIGSVPAGTGVCVFCHTPHGSDTNAAVPLWNRNLPTPTNYTQYSSLGTVTLDGQEAAVGSVSLACLSCHDGTQAMDSVINTPGPGMGAGGRLGDAAGDGFMQGTPVPNLGQDLTDDHPISIQYAGGGCDDQNSGTPQCGTFGDSDFEDLTGNLNQGTSNGTAIWWLETGLAEVGGTQLAANDTGTRSKHDLLLYTRPAAPGSTANGNEPFVECGSCHDPHNNGTVPVQFMRVDNTNSQICLACHTK